MVGPQTKSLSPRFASLSVVWTAPSANFIHGVDLVLLPKVTVGKLALAWGWLRQPMISLVFLFTFFAGIGVDLFSLQFVPV